VVPDFRTQDLVSPIHPQLTQGCRCILVSNGLIILHPDAATSYCWLPTSIHPIVNDSWRPRFDSVIPADLRDMNAIAFEHGSRFTIIQESAFAQSNLVSFHVPASVHVIAECAFAECKALESVTFEWESQLERIDERAFAQTPICAVAFPLSLSVVGKSSFEPCQLLEMNSFENGSKLQPIDERAFYQARVCSIVFPASLSVVGKSSFESCQSLAKISLERNSRLQSIEKKRLLPPVCSQSPFPRPVHFSIFRLLSASLQNLSHFLGFAFPIQQSLLVVALGFCSISAIPNR
jgi:hypothetical protein